MPASRTVLLALTGLTLVPVSVAAPQDAAPDSALVRAAKATLRSDLRNFVTAQERFFADDTTYARSLTVIRPFFRPSRHVTIVLLTATDTGHSEIAIDDRVPELVCGMYVGNAPPPLGRGNEGAVVCREP